MVDSMTNVVINSNLCLGDFLPSQEKYGIKSHIQCFNRNCTYVIAILNHFNASLPWNVGYFPWTYIYGFWHNVRTYITNKGKRKRKMKKRKIYHRKQSLQTYISKLKNFYKYFLLAYNFDIGMEACMDKSDWHLTIFSQIYLKNI